MQFLIKISQNHAVMQFLKIDPVFEGSDLRVGKKYHRAQK